MQSLSQDIQKSAKMIFRVFFGSEVREKNEISDNYSGIGVDLLMDCDGRKKLSLFLEENTVKSIMKQLTGEDDINKGTIARDIVSELAYLIAVNAIDENYEDYKLYNPAPSQGIKNSDINSRKFSSDIGEFAIAIEWNCIFIYPQ